MLNRKWSPQKITSLSKVIHLEFFLNTACHLVHLIFLFTYVCINSNVSSSQSHSQPIYLKHLCPHQCILLHDTNYQNLKLFYLRIYFLFYSITIEIYDRSIVSRLFHFIPNTQNSAQHLLELNQTRSSRKRCTVYL